MCSLKRRTNMKHFFAILCMLWGSVCMTLAMDGTGTPEDPYRIGTADDLYEFADIVSGLHSSIDQNLNAYAVLTNDIVINKNVLDEDGNLNEGNFRKWRPICKYQISGAPAYRGVFDGHKHVIRGVYCTEGGDMSGFFSVLSPGAEVINVGFEDCYIKSSMGRDAGICGQCWGGHIRNCYFIGVVNGNGSQIGGICSLVASGSIENCFSVVDLSGHSDVDGICAIVQKSEIRNCYSMPLKGADTELEERFYTGEVAHLLQQGQSERVWGQRVGVDKYPVFWDDKVDSPAP